MTQEILDPTLTSSTPSTSSETPSPASVPTESVPADTAVSTLKPLNQVTKEATITKAEPIPEPVEVTPPATEAAPTKPNYDGMIQGFIDGDLTDEDYAAIEKSGLSKQDFEFMAGGYKAMQEKHTADLHNLVGGVEVYKSIQEYGAHNLTEEEIEVFNSALASNNPKIAHMAVLGLKAMHDSSRGKNPTNRVESTGATETSVQGYASQADLIRDMSDRRYGKDANYTKEINARRSKSAY